MGAGHLSGAAELYMRNIFWHDLALLEHRMLLLDVAGAGHRRLP